MAIIQISKTQQRTGNLVDLPQLDNGEFGLANDARRVFIGNESNTYGTQNIEVLTSYSNISFSQIDGAIGNLDIVANVANGEVLGFDGDNWVNKGGDAGGLITLGDVSNVKITGGALGYILETDGTGNLSWTPKGTISANISTASNANPVVVVTDANNFFTSGAHVTITGVSGTGATALNGNSYYANVLTANTFSLYTDSGLTVPFNGSGWASAGSGGRAIAAVGGATSTTAGGANTTIQYNENNLLNGSASFTFDYNASPKVLTLVGNANVTNLNATTAVTATTLTGSLTTASQPNVTSVGTLSGLGVNGTITAVNITANTGVFTGNGSGLTNIAGANVSGAVAYATTANSVAGANVSGEVSYASVANSVAGANVSGTVANATYAVSAGSTTTAGTVTTASQPNITSVGTLSNVSVSGTANVGVLATNTLTTGDGALPGTVTGIWTLSVGSTLQSTYADLAEYYEADDIYDPGTVLEFGGDKEVTIAEDGTTKVAGVVSTSPAYAMNTDCTGNAVPIALQGRVPVKVRGNITKGDMMVSGGNGYARPCNSPILGSVIGKALQHYNGTDGVIEIAVGRL